MASLQHRTVHIGSIWLVGQIVGLVTGREDARACVSQNAPTPQSERAQGPLRSELVGFLRRGSVD